VSYFLLFIDFTEYSIESGNEDRVFAVDTLTGAVYIVGELSYDRQRVCRQHLSYDVCLEVRGEIIRTVLCCIVY